MSKTLSASIPVMGGAAPKPAAPSESPRPNEATSTQAVPNNSAPRPTEAVPNNSVPRPTEAVPNNSVPRPTEAPKSNESAPISETPSTNSSSESKPISLGAAEAAEATGATGATGPTTHHISDVDTWGGADRNYFVFVVLSIVFGFFGLDHMYLRSYGTGFYKLMINILCLGLWYWWDLVQIATEAKKIRTDGLSSPMDWIRGIGRGVFAADDAKKPIPSSPKDYLLYTFLAVMFGWLGADKFYLGEYFQGFVKLCSCFNLFLLLFGWIWVLWDAFHAFFMTESILKDGITTPMPYSFMFSGTVPGSIFKVSGGATSGPSCLFCPPDISSMFSMFSPKTLYKDVVVPLMTPPILKAIDGIGKGPPACGPGLGLGLTMPSLPTGMPVLPNPTTALPATALPVVPNLATALPATALPATALPATALPTMPAMPSTAPRIGTQVGGGQQGQQGPGGVGPILAGTLTAVVLAGGLKGFYDVLVQQLG